MIDWTEKDSWVGVFDILGFKSRIQHTDSQYPRHLLTGQLEDIFKVLDGDAKKYGKLEYMVFSDTIVLFAPDLNISSYAWFLLQCKKIINKSIIVRLPLRGAISVGKAFVNSAPPIIIGTSFLEAHEYCEDQNWIGLLMTPSATLAVRQAGFEPVHHDFVDDKNIPLRKNSKKNVLAYRFQNGAANFASPFLSCLAEMEHFASDECKGKYRRTMDFIEANYRYIKENSYEESINCD